MNTPAFTIGAFRSRHYLVGEYSMLFVAVICDHEANALVHVLTMQSEPNNQTVSLLVSG